MTEPVAGRPYWPDAMGKVAAGSLEGLKSWDWAEERLAKSHNYWVATSRGDGGPHLMVVWGNLVGGSVLVHHRTANAEGEESGGTDTLRDWNGEGG